MKIIPANGGRFNAIHLKIELTIMKYFLLINLELGLWLESERMLHPVIDQVGVDTQNEVVKEEKRQRYDNLLMVSLFALVKIFLKITLIKTKYWLNGAFRCCYFRRVSILILKIIMDQTMQF